MATMPTKFTGMMQTGGPHPMDRVQRPPMRTGDPTPPQQVNTGVVPPTMRTGGPTPPDHANAYGLRMRTGGPNPATPMTTLPTPTPDAGRTASDGAQVGLPQRPTLPASTMYRQRPVSATGAPSAPPGPVGRPAGGLFRMMSGR